MALRGCVLGDAQVRTRTCERFARRTGRNSNLRAFRLPVGSVVPQDVRDEVAARTVGGFGIALRRGVVIPHPFVGGFRLVEFLLNLRWLGRRNKDIPFDALDKWVVVKLHRFGGVRKWVVVKLHRFGGLYFFHDHAPLGLFPLWAWRWRRRLGAFDLGDGFGDWLAGRGLFD